MIIDENLKKDLNTWINTNNKSIYSQFEKKCTILSKISNMKINPMQYYLQYDFQAGSLAKFENLQTQLYKKIAKKYPNLEFGMSGRLKSPASHYEKVIRKFVEEFERDEFKPIEILDDYAMKIFTFAIRHPIDKVGIDSEGIYIDSNEDEFRITKNDCFEFEYNNDTITVPVKTDENQEDALLNVWNDNGAAYICTEINGEAITLLLKNAKVYKRSNKEDLIDYCAGIQETAEAFFHSKKFVTRKRKDYISRPKPSGYASRQVSFYNENENDENANLGLECQIRTYDMEKFNNFERTFGYKPHESKISPNSLNLLPRFIVTTKFKSGIVTYELDENECFKYVYGMSLEEYFKKMKATLSEKNNKKKIEEDER